jgi:hypothetical protein
VLARAGELEDSQLVVGETFVRGLYSVQTVLRCLVKMKHEEKNFLHPDIESFIEENVSPKVDRFLVLGFIFVRIRMMTKMNAKLLPLKMLSSLKMSLFDAMSLLKNKVFESRSRRGRLVSSIISSLS